MLTWMSYAFAFSSLTYHFFPLLLERGLDSAGAVAVLTAIGAAQVAERVVVRAFASDAPVWVLGSAIVIAFPLAVIGFAYAPPKVLIIGVVAVFYGAAKGTIIIVRGHGSSGDGDAHRIRCRRRVAGRCGPRGHLH